MSTKARQMTNFLSSNITVAVSAVVRILLIPVMIRQLGLGGYGIVAFAMSIGLLVQILGNALSGAIARYLTLGYARGESENNSLYMSNALAIVAGGGTIIALLTYTYVKVFSENASSMPTGFIEVILLSIVISTIAGVFSTGNFVREKFVSRSAINSFSRIIYGSVCGLLLLYSNLGMWSVVVGLIIGAVVRLILFRWSFKRLLPDVQSRLSLVSSKHMLEVGEFVGWMLLSFCGGYIISSGMIVVVEKCVLANNLGRYALAVNVSQLLYMALGCLTVITSPPTYKRIAVKDYRGATYQVEKYLFLALCLGIPTLVILILEGNNILHVWLGESTPPNMGLLLVVAGISGILTTSNIPISVFLAGMGKVRNYGIATLVAACTAVTAGIIILRTNPTRLVWVAALPGLAIIIKNSTIIFLHRKYFEFSPGPKLLMKVGGLALLSVATLFAGWCAKTLVTGNSIFQLASRLLLIGLPIGIFLLFLLRPKREKEPLTEHQPKMDS